MNVLAAAMYVDSFTRLCPQEEVETSMVGSMFEAV
jgi:hypothetical protein